MSQGLPTWAPWPVSHVNGAQVTMSYFYVMTFQVQNKSLSLLRIWGVLTTVCEIVCRLPSSSSSSSSPSSPSSEKVSVCTQSLEFNVQHQLVPHLQSSELGVVVQVFNPRTREAEAVGFLWVQGQPVLHSEFQDGRDYIKRLCFKQTNQTICNLPTLKCWDDRNAYRAW